MGKMHFGRLWIAKRVEQHAMWQMLRGFGVCLKLTKAVLTFHVDSTTCVRLGVDVSRFLYV